MCSSELSLSGPYTCVGIPQAANVLFVAETFGAKAYASVLFGSKTENEKCFCRWPLWKNASKQLSTWRSFLVKSSITMISFFVSLRARKNDEFGSLDRAEFDPAYYHSIMSGYSPPAWLRCVTSISKMWDLEFPLEDNSGKWCRERLSTLIPTLRVVSTAKTIGTFSSTHARQQTRTRPKLIGNLFAKGQWTALGSLRRTWSLLQPGIRPGILHQMHQQASWIFLDLPYPEISRVLWSHCSCSCSILFHPVPLSESSGAWWRQRRGCKDPSLLFRLDALSPRGRG